MNAHFVTVIVAAVSLAVGAVSMFLFMQFNTPYRLTHEDRVTSTRFLLEDDDDASSWRSKRSTGSRRKRRSVKSPTRSVSSMRTARSALSSPSESDDEFFDFDDDSPYFPDEETDEFREQQAKFLECVDEIVERGTCADFSEAHRLLLDRCKEYGENAALLWRLAKCCYLLKSEKEDAPASEVAALTAEGLEYAEKALQYNDHDADAHKWFAILTGDKGNSLGTKEKIHCGYVFKKHLDRAIHLKADDPSLHHLNGIFQYELGKLSWFEKTMASALFDTLPQATIKDALEDFHRAGRLSKKPWKMNCVYLAKCYHQDGCHSDAKRWLDAAAEIETRSNEDRKAEEEIISMRRSLKL